MLGPVWYLIRNTLAEIGLWRIKGKVLFLGIENAGKTTLLHMLKDDRLGQHVPTHHPTSEEFIVGKFCLTTHDLGGHETGRRVWRDYFPQADGIVFLVDASDNTRLQESKEQLSSLLRDDEFLADCPILVLGNKIDSKSGALTEYQLCSFFEILDKTTGKGVIPRSQLSQRRPLEVFMCSVLKRQGYGDGIRWLAQYIDK